ncbi:ScyD/ScyE family protein [Nocardioides sp. J2M5]|uniref:ScyD/ScyE family protein n=1 Tax=Nocardioides palaemonis TaxID=2829810 RepID=UPI001BAE3C4A|nr:ScyD/ScyE family protein [Nocardioides palaemonis]MBS2940420.1 ScyD/ScyE family protein [Nocardioides palaemonis]
MELSTTRVRGRRHAAGGSLLTLALTGALTLAPGAASADGHGHHGHHPSPPDGPMVVATGLDNPRQLSFDDGVLYVAEAGTGGTEACQPGPEGGDVCFGQTGAVTRIGRGGQERVLEGLPSIAAPDGSAAIGPSDVSVHGGWYAVLVGLGADPSARSAPGAPAYAPMLGTLLGGRLDDHSGRHGGHARHDAGPRVIADVSAHEAAANPDGAQVDSNPVGLVRARGGWIVADAGGNDVVRVNDSGRIATLGVFPTRLVPPPPFLPPGDIPMDAVPTSAVRGPDGALYVSQLTGFPFPAGGSTIWRLVRGEAPTVYATGLTNVTDLGWRGGRLYAVQLADDGLLAVPEGQPPSGSLLRVDPGGAHEVVADDLVAPYGLAFAGHSAYVSTCSVCPDGGQVVRLPLR